MAPFTERVTPEQACCGQVSAPEGAVLVQGLKCIGRATWKKSTMASEPRAEGDLIHPDETHQKPLGERFDVSRDAV
jgi:hypothetical protein